MDDSFKEGKAAAVLVFHNWTGKILWTKSCLFFCQSARMAEVKALDWASKCAANGNWHNVMWVSDSMEVVKEASSKLPPWNWDSYYHMLIIKERFSNFSWKLV